MSTVLVFEHYREANDSPARDWKLKAVLSGPLDNGFIWNQVQPLLNTDIRSTGECADFILLVEDTFAEDNTRQSSRAIEFKTKMSAAVLVDHRGLESGR